MNLELRKSCFCLALSLGTWSAAHAVLLFNDDFSDGDRTTISPTSANWALLDPAAGTHTVAVAAGTGLTLTYAGSSTSSGYLVATMPVSTLGSNVGDALKMTFSFQYTLNGGSTSALQVRSGFVNSNGSSVLADQVGSSNDAIVNDTGYSFVANSSTNFSTIAAAQGIFNGPAKRTTVSTNNYYNSGSDWTKLSETFPLSDDLTDTISTAAGEFMMVNTTYDLSMTITRIEGGVQLHAALNGGGLSILSDTGYDTTSITESFDTYFMRFNNSGRFGTFTVTGLRVEQTLVPEPGSFALLAGLGALLLLYRRR